MSRGRHSNHLYAIATPDQEPAIEHGPQRAADDPIDLVRDALHRDHPKLLALDTGIPAEHWTLDQLTTERHRLETILRACPPDRTMELRSHRAKQRRLNAELEPLEQERDRLEKKRLRGPRRRAELAALHRDIDDRRDELSEVETELPDLEKNQKERHRYIRSHRRDADRWEHLNTLIDDRLREGMTIQPRASDLRLSRPSQEADGLGL